MTKITVVFDLKGTLVSTDGQLLVRENNLLDLIEKAKVIVYSINEPWTIQQLNKYSALFSRCQKILLVDIKQVEDLANLQYEGLVIVIGDDPKAEVAFARANGFQGIEINESNTTKSVLDIVRKGLE